MTFTTTNFLLDPSYQRTIFRETQVIIVPFCEYFESFQKFEGVLQAINLARKDAKDFVTDISIEKMETCDGEWKYVYSHFASEKM